MKLPILTAAALALLMMSSAGADDMKGMAMSAKSGASPSDKAYAASMSKMMKDMHAKPTGKPDKDFVAMMLPHHQGAVDMAKVELQYGSDPELRQLATDIIAAQDKEIAQMKAWLAKAGN
jgi:uncharacterized protein (DUF305 family)